MQERSIIRRIHLGSQAQTLGCNHHRIVRTTNAEKTWRRYAGCLVISGGGTYRDWLGRTQPIEPPCFVHHLPGRFHDIRRSPGGWEEYSLMADAGSAERWLAQGLIDGGQPVAPLGDAGPHRRRFERLFRCLISDEEADWRGGLVVASELLLAIWEDAQRARLRDAGHLLLEEARARLAADLAGALDLEALARACGLPYITFRRRFKQAYGEAPGAYRNRLRLEQAALILAHEACTVAEVAERLAYADPFVFSRRFKQQHGMPPSAYQARHYTG